MDNLRKAMLAAQAAADEATTIAKYLEMLLSMQDGENSEEINREYREIIADEFNHIAKFTTLSAALCGIEIPED